MGFLGLGADKGAGKEAMEASREQIELAVKALEDIGIPEVEAMKMVYEMPEIVGTILPEQLQTGVFSQIEVSPDLERSQLDALEQMKDVAKGGVTEADIMAYEDIGRRGSADAAAQQATILGQMAQRGSLDSGASLAAQLGAQQAGATRQAESGRGLVQEALARRERAIQNVAQQSGDLSQQQYGRQFKTAQAESELEKQNAMFRQQAAQKNLSEQQRVADTQTQLINQQQQHNKSLLQQDYMNRMGKAKSIAGARTGAAQALQQQAAAEAQSAQQSAAGNRQLLTAAAKMAGTMYGGPAGGAAAGAATDAAVAEEGGVISSEAPGRTAEDVSEYPGATSGPDNMVGIVREGEMYLNAEEQKELFDFIKEKKGSEMSKISSDMDEIKKLLGIG